MLSKYLKYFGRSTLYFGPLTKTTAVCTPQTGLKSVVLSWASFCSAMFSATHVYIVYSKTPAPIMHCTVQRQTSHYWYLSLFRCAKLLQFFSPKSMPFGCMVLWWSCGAESVCFCAIHGRVCPVETLSPNVWALPLCIFVSLSVPTVAAPVKRDTGHIRGSSKLLWDMKFSHCCFIHANNYYTNLIMHILKCIWQLLCFWWDNACGEY